MTETSIAIPSEDVVTRQLTPLQQMVTKLEVKDKETHRDGIELGKRITALSKFVKEFYAEPKRKAHELHKLMTSKENKFLLPLNEAKGELDRKLNAYEQEERRRADEEARAREAEARRIEEERQIQEAVAAEDAGDKDLAESVLNQPIAPVVIVPEPEVAKVAGASTRVLWGAKVVDLHALVKYCAANPEHLNLLLPNETALNGLARALKGEIRIPGIRATSTTSRVYRDI